MPCLRACVRRFRNDGPGVRCRPLTSGPQVRSRVKRSSACRFRHHTNRSKNVPTRPRRQAPQHHAQQRRPRSTDSTPLGWSVMDLSKPMHRDCQEGAIARTNQSRWKEKPLDFSRRCSTFCITEGRGAVKSQRALISVLMRSCADLPVHQAPWFRGQRMWNAAPSVPPELDLV